MLRIVTALRRSIAGQAAICSLLAALLLLPVAPAPAADAVPGAPDAVKVAALVKLFGDLKLAANPTAARVVEQQIWQAWLQSGDDSVDGMTQQSIYAMQSGQLQVALALLDAVVSKAPGFAVGWNKRATVLYMLGQLDRSLEDCGKVLALEPRHFGALSGVGLIRIAKGDKPGALDAYRKVIGIYPQSLSARANVEALEKELEGDPT